MFLLEIHNLSIHNPLFALRFFYYICQVKIFALILSLYFLGLNFIPCDDTVVSDNQDPISVSLDLDHDQEEQHSNSDDCPPFCQCHCCHVHVVQFSTNTFEILEIQISTLIIQKGENLGEEIPDFHFQPPRV